MKKWYEKFEWAKLAEPAFRWIAIAFVAVLAPSAISLGSGGEIQQQNPETTIEQASTAVVIDSLRKCVIDTKNEIRAIQEILRENSINDSNSRIIIQQQITYTREDLADIKRILMSRAFAYAR